MKLASDRLLASFGPAFEQLRATGVLSPALRIKDLKAGLDIRQRAVVDRILDLDPHDFGINIPLVGREGEANDLVVIKGQAYVEVGQTKTLKDVFVPRHVYEAYVRMNRSFEEQHPHRILLIESGYRSPAYQVMTFIYLCREVYQGDVGSALRRVSPPAYSQHTSATKTALDFFNVDGLPTESHPEDFEGTSEYVWLKENARTYGFFESWKKGNEYGMGAEPWHWQYLGSLL